MQTEDFAPFPTAPLKTSRIQMTVNIFKNCLKMEAVFQKKKKKEKKQQLCSLKYKQEHLTL